jgi:hypothetical protein
MAPPPLPEKGGPLRNDGGLGLGGRHPSKLSMSGRRTRLRSPFKVKVTNGHSVVGTRVWLVVRLPFTSERVYGAAGGPVQGFRVVSSDQKEKNLRFLSSSEDRRADLRRDPRIGLLTGARDRISCRPQAGEPSTADRRFFDNRFTVVPGARSGRRAPGCLGGDLDVSGAWKTSLRQSKLPWRKGGCFAAREGYFAAGEFTLRQGSRLRDRGVDFATEESTLRLRGRLKSHNASRRPVISRIIASQIIVSPVDV